MISHPHRVVFVHVPKTAGTSVEALFGHHGSGEVVRDGQDHRTLRQLQWPHGLVGIPAAGPAAARENVAEALRAVKARVRPPEHAANRLRLTRRQYDEYLKFAVVRNPWDRVWSWYRNVTTDPLHRARLGIRGDETLAELLPRQLGHDMLRPQTYWLRDFRGRIGVDVVCRYERLDADVAEVTRRAGLTGAVLPHLNSGTTSAAYVDAFDDVARRLVAEAHRDDLSAFGYRFGDADPA